MFRPVLPLTAALLVVLAACSTTEPSSASADSSMSSSAATASAPTASDSSGMASSTSTDTSTSTGATTNTATANCNADAARSVVGQTASTEIIDQARTAAGAETARTLKPGEAATMEFNGNRLNLDVDASNTITNVRCG